MGSWKDRGNQYIQLVKVLYCKLLTNASNYQLSHLRLGWEANPNLRGGRRECYHSATVAPVSLNKIKVTIKSFQQKHVIFAILKVPKVNF